MSPGHRIVSSKPRGAPQKQSTHHSQKQQARRRGHAREEGKTRKQGELWGQAGPEGVQGALKVCGVCPLGWGSSFRCCLFHGEGCVCLPTQGWSGVRQQRWKSQKNTSHILRAVIANPTRQSFLIHFFARVLGVTHIFRPETTSPNPADPHPFPLWPSLGLALLAVW